MNVTIDKLAERRLWALIRATKVEVGGMGYAFLERDDSIHVREVFLTPQEVTSTEVDFESTNGDAVFVERAIKDGVLGEPNFVPFSFHSHHTMDAYWSGTDDSRIAAMQKVGVKRLLSFVGSHDGTYKMRVDTFDFEAHGIYFPQVTMSVTLTREAQELTEFERQIKAEFEQNVKEKKYTFFSSTDSYTNATDSYTNGNGKDKRSARQILEQDESRVVSELYDAGLTHTDARAMLDEFGVDDCESLLDGFSVNGITLNGNGRIDP